MNNAVLEIRRHKPANGALLGELFINGKFFCWTLERVAVAIPAQAYQVVLSISPRFRKLMPLLVGPHVPASRGVRMHPGNQPTDSDACVLVGLAKMPNGLSIYRSQEAFEALMHALLGYGALSLTIHDAA